MPRTLSNRSVLSTRQRLQTLRSSVNFNEQTANRFVSVPGYNPTSTTFSFSLWFRLGRPVNAQRILSYRSTSGTLGGFELQENSSTDRLLLFGYDAAGSIAINLSPTTKRIVFGSWHHVVVTVTPGSTRMFIDGILAGTTGSTISMPIDQVLTLGRASASISSPMTGNISQFMYEDNIVWSDSNIADIYARGFVPPTASVVLMLDDGTGTVALDSSVNGRNGLISSGNGASFNTEIPFRRRVPTGNLAPNPLFAISPFNGTALTTTTGRWIDGSAGGSLTDNRFGWAVPSAAASGAWAASIDPQGLRLTATANTGSITVASYRQSALNEYIKLLPNTTYYLRAVVSTTNVGTNGVFADLREFNSAGTQITTTSTSKLSGNNSLAVITASITTSATTAYGVILLRNNVAGLVNEAIFKTVYLLSPDGRNIII